MAKANGKKTKAAKTPQGITHITVGGYKSIASEKTIEIRPLTVLAGANSSGKSSMMQPLLLLKQTLEATYDPGALLLNGPNVRFTSIEQMRTHPPVSAASGAFLVGIRESAFGSLRVVYNRNAKKEIDIPYIEFSDSTGTKKLERSMEREEMCAIYLKAPDKDLYDFSIERKRCFLVLVARDAGNKDIAGWIDPGHFFASGIQRIIHLPGLRGNPERAYNVASVGASFPGTFERYFASVIANWTGENNGAEIRKLGDDLAHLGSTWKVEGRPIDDTQVELKVARLPKRSRGGAHDLVNIADVGLGVSQSLPVVVALLAAEPGQLVYLEQPEIHLHPRAQVAMAQLLANAANRGVRVVVETHSSLLLLGIQSLVAEGKLPPSEVILHWFQRNDEGATDIRTADLDAAGRFGDWPEDFDDVSLEAQRRYLDAVDRRIAP
jgi:hypothetical protein